MIKANFNTYNNYVTDSLYQWDINQDLVIRGLNLLVAPEIHFANANMARAIVRHSTLESGVVTVRIPNSLLQEALTVKAYVGIYEGDTFKVIETIEIPIVAKPKPADYVFEDSEGEIYSFNALENEIVNAKKDIADKCDANRVEMVATAERVIETVNKTIENATESYENDLNEIARNLENDVEETTATLTAQVANIIAHNNDTDNNTELIDIRTGADGTVYESAGEAIREQIRDNDKGLHDVSNDMGNISCVLDNFSEGERFLKYSFGETDITKTSLRTNIGNMVSHGIPVMKNTLPDVTRGVTLCLASNEAEIPITLELYDQKLRLIKVLARETITGYKVTGLEQYELYATYHTFDCEFSKYLIKTDVAYLRVGISDIESNAAKRLCLGQAGAKKVREELNPNIAPVYYSYVDNPGKWNITYQTVEGGYEPKPDGTFIQILGKTLKTDSKSVYSTYGIPVVEFNGDIMTMSKDVAVNLTYKFENREGSCTLKWQGSSSLSYPKKNYTVKFDTAFEAKTGWGEQKKYCLKANYIDFSHTRNICGAKLWGGVVKSRTPENTRLTSLPNGGAIDGFPVCVVINGEYKGIYTFNIPKDGWLFGMGEGEKEAILCADASAKGACTFEALATLNGDFEVEYAPDEENTEWIKTSINRLINACMNSDGTDLDTTIAQYIDWESAIDYMAFCLVTQNYDGISKNYLLSTYDGIKWFFSAYDLDSTFGLWYNGSKFIKVDSMVSLSHISSSHKVFDLIKRYKSAELKSRYTELVNARNGALSEEAVSDTFINFAGSIPKALFDEEVKIWRSIPNTSINNVSQILDFNRRRRTYIDSQINAL
jgi:hypothetical protein